MRQVVKFLTVYFLSLILVLATMSTFLAIGYVVLHYLGPVAIIFLFIAAFVALVITIMVLENA